MGYGWLKSKYKKLKEGLSEKKSEGGESEIAEWTFDEWMDTIEATTDPDRLYVYSEMVSDSEILSDGEKVKILDAIHTEIEKYYK